MSESRNDSGGTTGNRRRQGEDEEDVEEIDNRLIDRVDSNGTKKLGAVASDLASVWNRIVGGHSQMEVRDSNVNMTFSHLPTSEMVDHAIREHDRYGKDFDQVDVFHFYHKNDSRKDDLEELRLLAIENPRQPPAKRPRNRENVMMIGRRSQVDIDHSVAMTNPTSDTGGPMDPRPYHFQGYAGPQGAQYNPPYNPTPNTGFHSSGPMDPRPYHFQGSGEHHRQTSHAGPQDVRPVQPSWNGPPARVGSQDARFNPSPSDRQSSYAGSESGRSSASRRSRSRRSDGGSWRGRAGGARRDDRRSRPPIGGVLTTVGGIGNYAVKMVKAGTQRRHHDFTNQRRAPPWVGIVDMSRDHQETLQIKFGPVFEGRDARFNPKNICAKCGHIGHWLSDCAFPDDSGFLYGCPVHNSRSHSFDDCPDLHKLTESQILWLLVELRGNKAPIRTNISWSERLRQAIEQDKWTSHDAPLPLTSAFVSAKVRGSKGGHDWLRFNYAKQTNGSLPSDPVTRGPHAEVLKNAALDQEVHAPTIHRKRGNAGRRAEETNDRNETASVRSETQEVEDGDTSHPHEEESRDIPDAVVTTEDVEMGEANAEAQAHGETPASVVEGKPVSAHEGFVNALYEEDEIEFNEEDNTCY
ncbi:Putative Zinc finger, CCHC-type [Colletotrichum destructivum]|uniref:Zinc finger, CCHC-type n=1 Tax=Colletotrichum destructivum TaxID=34406 RepID=A0AAX4HZI4_9PEZI|nr:Putative Zinc finger, CCHC-type [Colletotrichum destructivum]